MTLAELRSKFEGKEVVIKKNVSMVLGGPALDKINNKVEYGAGSVLARKEFNFFEHYRN